MPGRRIKDLTPLSGAGSANSDDVVIFDTDADATKRISRSQLAEGMQADVQVFSNKTMDSANNTLTINYKEARVETSDASRTHLFTTVAALLADGGDYTTYAAGQIVEAGGFRYQVAASGASDHHVTTAGGVKLYVLPEGQVYNWKAFGATGGGADETALLVTALGALSNYETLDLNGAEITVFNSVSGVAVGDAIALASVPRLYGMTGVTICNGSIKADSPSVSGSKLRFPTTLTFDGCTDCRLENVILHSKGESWGDTDASVGLGSEDRRAFAAQNGGHAFLNVRSLRTTAVNCQFRLCGSTGSFYNMSSCETKLDACFSNPGSLGYNAYCADSWAGNASVSGFVAHTLHLNNCSAAKEGYTYGSKGCVLSEDADVTITVTGGFYADAFANGTSRDIGYAFGASSSQTIVTGAVVENCASLGYSATTNNTDFTTLKITSVHATGLRKTVHQDEDTSVGRTYSTYTDVRANVVGGGTWSGDGDKTREETSYLAMPNAGNRAHVTMIGCELTGADYGVITDNVVYGNLLMQGCRIETNGFLWNMKGWGSGVSGRGARRGITMDRCAISDVSSEAGAYTNFVSGFNHYVWIDLSTSTISGISGRAVESSSIPSVGTYVERYAFPRPDANVETISADKILAPDSALVQSLNASGANRVCRLPRPDKYKFMPFTISNNASSSFNIVVRDYTGVTAYASLTPGDACVAWSDGSTYRVRLL